MSRGPDAATLLARALAQDAARARLTVAIEVTDVTRWASATFTGARHSITATCDAPGFAAWLAALPDAELPMRHHLVADLSVSHIRRGSGRATALIEALTVET